VLTASSSTTSRHGGECVMRFSLLESWIVNGNLHGGCIVMG